LNRPSASWRLRVKARERNNQSINSRGMPQQQQQQSKGFTRRLSRAVTDTQRYIHTEHSEREIFNLRAEFLSIFNLNLTMIHLAFVDRKREKGEDSHPFTAAAAMDINKRFKRQHVVYGEESETERI
jgi:hypothetical protein